MNIVGLFIAACLVLMGVVNKRSDTPRVLSSHDEPSETETLTPTETTTPAPTHTPAIPRIATATPTPKLITTSDNTLRYPNSTIKNDSDNVLQLESQDDPRTITEWYKHIIEQKHMNTKTIVQTKANGKVNNKLVANSANEELEITIKQESESANVVIVINHTDK